MTTQAPGIEERQVCREIKPDGSRCRQPVARDRRANGYCYQHMATQRRRTWGVVKKRKNGYTANYLGPDEIRHLAPFTFTSKVDAEAWLASEKRQIDANDWLPPIERARRAVEERQRLEDAQRRAEAMPTVADYGRQYVDRDILAGGSRDRYRQLLTFYILGEPATLTRRGMVKGVPVVKHGIGNIRVTELTRADVREWWQGLPVKTRESSCRQSYDLLRAIMNAAVEAELIEVNPVKVKAAAEAQVSRERDLDPLPFEILKAVAGYMPDEWQLGAMIGGVLSLRSGEVRALQRSDFRLSRDLPKVKVERAVKEAERKLELGRLKTARRGVTSRTLPIPAVLVPDIKNHLRKHAQPGPNGLLFWRVVDEKPVPVRSSAWLKAFKKACRQVASDLEVRAAEHTAQTGEPESDESQRIRRLLTSGGGYIFHGTRITGLTWSYRLSGGNLKAVQIIAGHSSSKTALRYQRAELDYLASIAKNVSAMIEGEAKP